MAMIVSHCCSWIATIKLVWLLLVLSQLTLYGISHKSSEETKGVLLLDSITFPKLVPNMERDVVILVCKKGSIGDYGTDSIRTDFFSLVNKIEKMENSGTENILFAQLIVNGGENLRIAETIGVAKDFVHPKLFVIPSGQADAIPYPDDEPFQPRYLLRFIALHAHLTYSMPGTLQALDDAAAEIMTNLDDDFIKRKAVEKAEAAVADLEEDSDKATAKLYLKVMRKVLDRGIYYLDEEIARQNRLLSKDSNKLSRASRRHVEHKLNVLHHFAAHATKAYDDQKRLSPEELKKMRHYRKPQKKEKWAAYSTPTTPADHEDEL